MDEGCRVKRDYIPAELDLLLLAMRNSGPVRASRVRYLARVLRGLPYVCNPLEGISGEPEALTAAVTGFDCVTLVETVTALSWSSDESGFLEILRNIRYRDGVVQYENRRHYFSHWLADLAGAGLATFLEERPGSRVWQRTLHALPAFGPVPAVVRGYPKRRLRAGGWDWQPGDLIGFISTRRELDYFHTGLLLPEAGIVCLLHASRQQGRVIVEPLAGFLDRNRMTGVTVVRPIEAPGPGSGAGNGRGSCPSGCSGQVIRP